MMAKVLIRTFAAYGSFKISLGGAVAVQARKEFWKGMTKIGLTLVELSLGA